MRFLSFLTTLIFAVLLSACGGGGGSAGTSSGAQASSLFSTAPAALNLNPGESGAYQISGGSPPYVASSGNASLVSAFVSGSSLSVVGLASGGPVTVVITDAKGASLSVGVTVASAAALSTTAPASISLAIGQNGAYTINGGVPPYVVSSSNQSVATASVLGSALTISGLRNGSASVVISDAKGGSSVTIAVAVAASAVLSTTAPSAITVASGQAGTYTINGGVPPYVVTSSNQAVATASVNGALLSINGVRNGAASIVVNDAGGSTPVTIAVTIAPSAVLSTTAPPAVTVASGQLGTYTINGGMPPYAVTSSNQSVATAAVNGSVLSINGVRNGVASIVINDASGGAAVTIAVTVAAATPLSTTAPTQLTMGAGVANSFLIMGGTAPYAAVSSNAALVSAAATGNVLSVFAAASGGPVSIDILDAQGAKLTVNVTVPAAGVLVTTSPPAITVASGQMNSFSISGGVPPYSVSSSNQSVAIASVSGSFLSISGVGSGAASIVLNDSKGSVPVTIGVTVPAPNSLYTTSPTAITIAPGQAANYLVGGGFPPYSASSSNAAVSSVSISGSVLTVSGNSAGPANIVVLDAKGASVQISVAVGSATSFYVNAPSAISLGVGASASYSVGGGAQPYSVNSSDSRIAVGTISGSTLTITPLKAGTASIQVFDGSGKSITITVTVDGASGASAVASIDILPSATSLPSAAGSTVTFLVTVKDASNNTVPGQTVTFVASSGSLVVNPSPAVTGASGSLASVSLSPGADASNRVITVTATVGAISKSISMPVVGTTVAVSGPGSTLMGTSGLVYSLRATDSAGKAINGAVLTMSSALSNPLNPQSVVTDVAGAGSVNYTATVAGTDTLTVSGLGTSGQTTVLVSNEDFAFVLPAVNSSLPVSSPNTVKVRYRLNGAGVAGQTVTFSSTRGTVAPASAVTDVNGEATVSVSSSTAGPATLSAQLGTARTTLAASFVAVTPNTVFLQANPSAILPNVSGSINQSALTATVRDAVGNPVAGQVVNFTAISDPSNGFITPGSATTDNNGMASAQFVPGAQSTPANGVVLRATVQNTAISSTTSLTVNGSALFISIGMSNDLTVVDRNTYAKSFSVYVTDVNGAPVANRAITLSVYPTAYGKGSLTYNIASARWVYSATSPTVCANEDANRNGILDAGEDTNGNSLLTPGLPVVLSPAALTTDANGYGTFLLNYGKNFAYWLDTQITAKASVSGTESSKTIAYSLAMTAEDAASPSSPANQISPFGVQTVCTNPN